MGDGAFVFCEHPVHFARELRLEGRYTLPRRVAWNIQYKIVLISNGLSAGRSDRMRAAIPVRWGAAQLVAGSLANGPR